jgi:hypothetical protein
MGHLKKFFKKIVSFSTRQQLVEQTYRQLHLTPGCHGVTDQKYFEQDITISLTTYSKRIFDVYLVIESIFQQTLKPNKVILWLAEDEFKNKKLPLKLTRLTDRGLEIKFCKDIKSYKKLIPTLQQFPEDIIITIDDDVIYPDDFLENMINSYSHNPDNVYCYRARYINFRGSGKFKKYRDWKIINKPAEASYEIIPNGIGGILYPPNCFHEDILKEDLFMSLAPKGDDIWFKTSTFLKGYKCQVIPIESSFFEKFVVIESSQDIALYHGNISSHTNNEQIKKVFKHYGIDAHKLKNGIS